MFSLFSGFWNYLFSKPNVHVLIIGLDHAGKTTILERIKTRLGTTPGLPPEKIPPTVGMNLAKITYKGSKVIFWDLGGQVKMRSMWERYYQEANAVVFVVDSADLGRLEEAKLAYDAACESDSLRNVPILTFANKQDLSGALSPSDLSMNFYPIQDAAERTKVFAVSAISGNGIEEAVGAVVEHAIRNARARG